MSERNTFITHKGREILFVDFSGLRPDDLVGVAEEAVQFMRALGRGELLVLYDVSRSKVGPQTADVLKKGAAATRTCVKKRAVVGVAGVQKIILKAINAFSQESITAFDDADMAKDWLVKD